ncbi:unnamed protein product [Gongylonema pulchrum]|uniref:Col_cuticle_N domain-containing protein n=1 Tax=Gongylonema pulchrum TaxID=637853 RepID=A0A183D1Y0_9BILA|nr:unnamed protein product [Gongylonema pulchrum]
MSVKVYVGLATAGSVFVIIMSLVAVCVIYNDINNLYDDVMDEMGEFKVLSLLFIPCSQDPRSRSQLILSKLSGFFGELVNVLSN